LIFQIFKTPISGWGVKTLSSIPKGTFITTYIGQLLTDEHVAGITRILHSLKHARSDIVNNLRYLVYLSDIVSSKCPNLPKTSIIVSDASKSGNFARFFNHSCDPNMFAQYIFVDSHDMRLPEVGFFTRRDIKEEEVRNISKNIFIKCIFRSFVGTMDMNRMRIKSYANVGQKIVEGKFFENFNFYVI
jgi:hypothetical protein